MSFVDPRRSLAADSGRRSTVIGGASITIAWRLFDRALTLVSMPILARLLAPEDFGLIALATVTAGLVSVFLELGVNAALIQQRSPSPEHYDAAWTLRVIQACLVGLIVFSISWPAAEYFRDPRLIAVIQLISVTTALGGLENIGIVLLQKNFEFRREIRYFLFRRLLSFTVTLSLVVWLRTYWALVLGALAGQIFSLILSYWLQPFRPRFALGRVKDILSFSQWVVVRGIGGYISNALPSLVLGRSAGPAGVGVYGAATELSNVSSGEILAPLARVLYPALVDARDSPEAFQRAVSIALGVQFMITLPASIGLALVSEEAVSVLLGPKWSAAAPVLALLALGSMFTVFQHTGGYALMAMGKIRLQAFMMWIEAAAFALLATAFLAKVTPAAVAELRLFVMTGIAWLFGFLLSRRPVALPWRLLVGSFVRPLIACFAMAVCLKIFDPYAPTQALGALFAKIALGAAVYFFSNATLWLVTGSRSVAEAYLLEKVLRTFASLKERRSRRRANNVRS